LTAQRVSCEHARMSALTGYIPTAPCALGGRKFRTLTHPQRARAREGGVRKLYKLHSPHARAWGPLLLRIAKVGRVREGHAQPLPSASRPAQTEQADKRSAAGRLCSGERRAQRATPIAQLGGGVVGRRRAAARPPCKLPASSARFRRNLNVRPCLPSMPACASSPRANPPELHAWG
jgi:hypothetical protein